jgi:LysM repeat protein
VKFIFTDGATELVIPVTPDSFRVPYGNKIETVNIHELGDVNIAGYGTLPALRIDCMFPAHAYPFVQPEANTADPYSYVQQFRAWIEAKTALRFIISDTSVNIPVLLEEIEYGEQDGTGDVYAGLSLRGYRELTVVTTSATESSSRTTTTTATAAAAANTYTVVAGDTLSAICRRFYGEPSLYPQLASYNKLTNANLIRTGQVLTLPDIETLKGTRVTCSFTEPGLIKNRSAVYIEKYSVYKNAG